VLAPFRVLITGATGQIGQALVKARIEGAVILPVSHADCEITDYASVHATVTAFRPNLVFNLAAYTAVDQAENDAQTAFAINSAGAGNVARASALAGARIIHVSTDYVFDGRSSIPYAPNAFARPINVYGASKFAGENAVRIEVSRALIIRSGWVFSSIGKNFVLRILELLRSGETPKVVCDQLGTPTSADDLARVLWLCAMRPEIYGIYHFSNSGQASWFELATKIQALLSERGGQRYPPIIPVTSADYRSPALRPRYSVLDSSALLAALPYTARPWEAALVDTMNELGIGASINPSTTSAR
jgi:dTDP-4-dehydrorhamnose reductase